MGNTDTLGHTSARQGRTLSPSSRLTLGPQDPPAPSLRREGARVHLGPCPGLSGHCHCPLQTRVQERQVHGRQQPLYHVCCQRYLFLFSLCKSETTLRRFSHCTHIHVCQGGKIRVIGQENGDTTLLREHTQTLLDLKLSSTSTNSSNSSTTRSNSKSSRLASVSLDDTVRVWALDIGDGEIQ